MNVNGRWIIVLDYNDSTFVIQSDPELGDKPMEWPTFYAARAWFDEEPTQLCKVAERVAAVSIRWQLVKRLR